MSQSVDQAYVNMFTDNVIMLYQQEMSKLRGMVREKQSIGEFEFFERIGPVEMVEKTVRHSPTQRVEQDHTRRRVAKQDWRLAELVDENDLHRLLIDPRSASTQNFAKAAGRRVDRTIITAFDANAQTGKDGSTSVAFPAGQQIADGGTGMTVAKLRQARQTMSEDDVPMEGRSLVYSPDAVNGLLGETSVTSSDFNTIRALVAGDVNAFVGFNFVESTLLPITGNIRSCYAWHSDAMGLALGQEFQTRVDQLPETDYSWQIHMAAAFGAVRVLDEGVVRINIDETA